MSPSKIVLAAFFATAPLTAQRQPIAITRRHDRRSVRRRVEAGGIDESDRVLGRLHRQHPRVAVSDAGWNARWPRILTPGPILEAPRYLENVRERSVRDPRIGQRVLPYRMAVGNAADARKAIDSLVKLHVDFVKVRTEESPESYFAILREARRVGLKVAGHAPFVVSVTVAADSGQRDIEHAFAPLAGTDAGSVLIYPGFALHEELRLLVEDAGLTPLEALWSATIGPARFAGLEAKLGNIAPGKIADLVLLDANPLDNIRNTRRVSTVIQGGRVFTRKDLDGLMDKARRARTAPRP